ncbi:acyl-CoA dehydrogenase [Camelimonas fluminis]|uniref:Acyl-[acyl-carrier-protein] dehydrogenase MbtN n=1 Tax=Camelimonas fluminis TaxID=1576911 RepID=A0ABV7UKS5_9HYPH|nr:acyl-CoA dehydrogenase family protein [Camelimonas fluminis]GHE53825.1 acyl-CoA dehydrogenase [Camelimonas fluminis]
MSYRSPWMNEELDQVRDTARKFLEAESAPHHARWAKQHMIDRTFWNAAGDLGLLCVSCPTEYGGGGGTFAHEAVVMEEQARVGDDAWNYSVHSTIVAHYFAAYGTEEQKRRWLPRLASGEFVGAIAMTEPGTGSDLQGVRTHARRDGDEFVVNGAKTFISNGTHCDLLIIVARTTDAPGGKGLSLLVAETRDLPGFSRGRELEKIGAKGGDLRELFFEDMRIPAANVLGGVEGQGFVQLMKQLPQERLSIAVLAAAACERAVDLAVQYAKERSAFGQNLLSFQNTRFVLAECRTEAYAIRTFVDHCIGLHLEGKLDAATASMAKYLATDKQGQIIDRCLQVFGGYGYMEEYPIARMYTAARVTRIYGGANEIMKELIARTL